MKLSYYVSKMIKKMQIPAVKNSRIDKQAKICTGAHVVDCTIDKYSYIGNFTTVLNCEIGKYCSIADHCEIGGMSHPLEWVTTSPVAYNGKNCLKKNYTELEFKEGHHTVIENDVWIGDGCHIKAGVHLSTGCVIGMGSVVTKDVGPYEIWAGNPARFIRKRFADDNISEQLLKLQWWNWSEDKIKEYAKYFNNPMKFIQESAHE